MNIVIYSKIIFHNNSHVQLTMFHNKELLSYGMYITNQHNGDSEIFFEMHDLKAIYLTLNYILTITNYASIKIELLLESQIIEPAVIVINKDKNNIKINLKEYEDLTFSEFDSTTIDLSQNDIIEFRDSIAIFLERENIII